MQYMKKFKSLKKKIIIQNVKELRHDVFLIHHALSVLESN